MSEHFGVYGLWRQHGLVVCVRKSRGPYTGQLDLPGGTPEPDETPQQTLRRELLEECGVHVKAHGPWSPFTLQVHRTSTGQSIDLRHRGLLTAVGVLDDVAAVHNVEDVAAVELCDPQDCAAGELSPLLRHALSIERELLH